MTSSIQRGTGKWTLDDVRELGTFMAEKGLTVIELAGLKLVRHPQVGLYDSLGSKAQEFASIRQPTDEELLENPMAGLDEVTGNG